MLNSTIATKIKDFNDLLESETPTDQLNIISAFLAKNTDLRDAVAVRACDDVNMFGETKTDKISTFGDPSNRLTRYSIQVLAYPWRPAGASIIPIWRDETGLAHVALVYNLRKDLRTEEQKAQGNTVDKWLLCEGFMHPKPCTGSDHITLIHPDLMDQAEELVLKKEIPVTEAYQQAAQDHPELLQKGAQATKPDENLEDTAKREAFEEIGLDLEDYELKQAGSRTEGVMHHWYYVELNQEAKKYDTKNKPPEFHIADDNVEIGQAQWFSQNDFEITIENNKISITADGIEVPMKYALMIGQALYKAQNHQVKAASNSLFDKAKYFLSAATFFSSKANATMSSLFENRPELKLAKNTNLDHTNIGDIDNLPGKNAKEKFKHLKYLAQLQSHAAVYNQEVLEQMGVVMGR